MSLQSTQRPSCEQSINWETLTARCIGRIDLVEKALARFQGTLSDDINQLEEAAKAVNTDEVARIAHRIKGTSLTVSADRLAAYAWELEQKAEEKHQDVDDILTDIRDECCHLSEIIEKHRQEPPVE